jgi:hypothetical protein
MSPAEIADAVRKRLAAELDDDRGVLERLAGSVAELAQIPVTDARTETMRALALAFEVERWYSAAEATLERILRTIDGDVPTGPTWHAELLRAACVPVEDLRPVVLGREAATELRELLKFRHFARHGYDRKPEPSRMAEQALRVGRAQAAMAGSLDAFEAWLRGRS